MSWYTILCIAEWQHWSNCYLFCCAGNVRPVVIGHLDTSDWQCQSSCYLTVLLYFPYIFIVHNWLTVSVVICADCTFPSTYLVHRWVTLSSSSYLFCYTFPGTYLVVGFSVVLSPRVADHCGYVMYGWYLYHPPRVYITYLFMWLLSLWQQPDWHPAPQPRDATRPLPSHKPLMVSEACIAITQTSNGLRSFYCHHTNLKWSQKLVLPSHQPQMVSEACIAITQTSNGLRNLYCNHTNLKWSQKLVLPSHQPQMDPKACIAIT